jgi:cytochrome c oxidase subunit II
VRRSLLLVVTPLAGALALAAVASASNGGIAPVEPVSPNGQRITDAYWLILGVTGAVFLIVEGTLLAFVIRYRRRGRPREAEPEQIHGSTRIEVAWTVAPVVLLAVIVAFVFYKLPGIKNTPAARASGDSLDITVEAHQYYWLFKYPGGRLETINTLVVPVNKVVNLELIGVDVAHSWWVPAFGGKTDAIPGKTNHTWFKAEKVGNYAIKCAEFCGLQHTVMTGVVRVVQGPSARNVSAGRLAFEGACASCHGLQGQGAVGPAIASSPTLQDPKALRTLLENGGTKMPAVGKTWSPRLTNALIAYLKAHFGGTGGG